MEEMIDKLKELLSGTWKGEGYSKYPTIEPTAYSEIWTFSPDEHKPCIHYNQKTRYKNETIHNGETVFWDTGFILLKEDNILLISSQAGGRQETYILKEHTDSIFTFESQYFTNDPRMIRSQRILKTIRKSLEYELNMQTRENNVFENHLVANLLRSDA